MPARTSSTRADRGFQQPLDQRPGAAGELEHDEVAGRWPGRRANRDNIAIIDLGRQAIAVQDETIHPRRALAGLSPCRTRGCAAAGVEGGGRGGGAARDGAAGRLRMVSPYSVAVQTMPAISAGAGS